MQLPASKPGSFGSIMRAKIVLASLVVLVASVAAGLWVAWAHARPTNDLSVLGAISVKVQSDEPWTVAGTDEMPVAFTDRWSPFYWAVNAAIMAGQPRPVGPHVRNVAQELLRMLEAHTEVRGDDRLVAYDFSHRYFDTTLTPPWYSALGNAYVAIGLMHLADTLQDQSLMQLALSYLRPIVGDLSKRDPNGDLWFEEIVDETMPGGEGIINGHFGAVAALQEWRRRTGDAEFDDAIGEGLDTFAKWLPKVVNDGYFGYSRQHPAWRDYGQERASNIVQAACDISERQDLCDLALEYRSLLKKWTSTPAKVM
jgi:hypothetical protein